MLHYYILDITITITSTITASIILLIPVWRCLEVVGCRAQAWWPRRFPTPWRAPGPAAPGSSFCAAPSLPPFPFLSSHFLSLAVSFLARSCSSLRPSPSPAPVTATAASSASSASSGVSAMSPEWEAGILGVLFECSDAQLVGRVPWQVLTTTAMPARFIKESTAKAAMSHIENSSFFSPSQAGSDLYFAEGTNPRRCAYALHLDWRMHSQNCQPFQEASCPLQMLWMRRGLQ